MRAQRLLVSILILLTVFSIPADAAHKTGAAKSGKETGVASGRERGVAGGNSKAGGKSSASSGALAPPGDANLRLEKQIAAIKAAPDTEARADAAGGLVDALVGVNTATLTPQTIGDVAALLASPENRVRYWAALALAQIGPPASTAAPALEKALRDAEKLKDADPQSPANGICLAFSRIGAKPANGRCVDGQYLDAKEKAAYGTAQAKPAPSSTPAP